MQQENSAATALRVVYAVIASILIIVFASNLAMWATIMVRSVNWPLKSWT